MTETKPENMSLYHFLETNPSVQWVETIYCRWIHNGKEYRGKAGNYPIMQVTRLIDGKAIPAITVNVQTRMRTVYRKLEGGEQ